MTRIYLLLDSENVALLVFDDPRAPRELVKAINTGAWQPSPTGAADAQPYRAGANHWAVHHDPLAVVTVVEQPPPVALTPRHYDVLFGLVDGQPAKEIAARLQISRRTVYLYISELKERLGARSRAHLIAMAVSKGLLNHAG